MNKTKLSIGYKIIAYLSVAIGAMITLATLFTSLSRFSEIPMGAIIITLIAGFSLWMAGQYALKSMRTGFYLYLISCTICLVKYIAQAIFRLGLFPQLPQSLSGLVAVIFGMGGFPFWVALFGAIISYYELKKFKKVEEGNQ